MHQASTSFQRHHESSIPSLVQFPTILQACIEYPCSVLEVALYSQDVARYPSNCSRSKQPSRLQVIVIVVGEGHVLGLLHLLGVLGQQGLVDLGRGRGQGRSSDEFLGCALVFQASYTASSSRAAAYQSGVANQLASQPQEGLLKVIIGLGRDVVVLQVLLAVEGDSLGLDLALLDVDLVAAEDDGDVFAHADEVTYHAVSRRLPRAAGLPGEDARCQLGTFLYVIREVTSNMMMPHWPLM